MSTATATQISGLYEVASLAPQARLIKIGWFYERYHPLMYKVLQTRLGLQSHDIDNLVQDFFLKRIVDGNFVQTYLRGLDQPGKRPTRFRNYLAKSVFRFALDWLKSRPDLDPIEMSILEEEETTHTMSQALAAEELQDLVTGILRDTRRYLIENNKQLHWESFLLRFIRPALTDNDGVSYDELTERLGCRDTKQTYNLVTTAIRAFRRTWKDALDMMVENGDYENAIEAVSEFQECTAVLRLADMRRPLAEVLGLDCHEDDNPSRPVNLVLDMASDGIGELTDLEQQLLFQSYLETPVAQLLGQDSSHSDSTASNDTMSFRELMSIQSPAAELLGTMNKSLQQILKHPTPLIPKPMAAALRFSAMAIAARADLADVSAVAPCKRADGISRCLACEWLDDSVRLLLTAYLKQLRI